MSDAFRKYLILFFMMLLCFNAGAQGTTVVRGVVKDGYGTPLEDVMVLLSDPEHGYREMVDSDAKGRYVITNVSVGGEYEIKFQLLGYSSVEYGPFTVTSETYTCNVTLEYDEEFNSSAVRRRAVSPAHLDRESATMLPSFNHSLNDILIHSEQTAMVGELRIAGEDAAGSALFAGGERVAQELLPAAAVAQTAIINDSYDVRFDGITGGFAEVATMRGSSTFHGSAYGFASIDDGACAGADFGGAVAGRAYYYASAEWTDLQSRLYGRTDIKLSESNSLSADFGYATGGSYLVRGSLLSTSDGCSLSNRLAASMTSEGLYLNEDFTLSKGGHLLSTGGSLTMGGSYFAAGLFARDELQLGGRMLLDMGLRADLIAGDFTIGPRASLRWDLLGSGRWLIKGGAGLFSSYSPEIDRIGARSIFKSSLSTEMRLPGSMAAEAGCGFNLSSTGWLFRTYLSAQKNLTREFFLKAGYAFSLQNRYGGYALPHKAVASIGWNKHYLGRFATAVTLSYVGGPERMFTFVYGEDGLYGNCPIFVPSSRMKVEFVGDDNLTAEEQRELYTSYINGFGLLKHRRSGYVGVNEAAYPWVNLLDLRIVQQLMLRMAGRSLRLQAFVDLRNPAGLVDGLAMTRSYRTFDPAIFTSYGENEEGNQMLTLHPNSFEAEEVRTSIQFGIRIIL